MWLSGGACTRLPGSAWSAAHVSHLAVKQEHVGSKVALTTKALAEVRSLPVLTNRPPRGWTRAAGGASSPKLAPGLPRSPWVTTNEDTASLQTKYYLEACCTAATRVESRNYAVKVKLFSIVL
jgi:hypothetical protein